MVNMTQKAKPVEASVFVTATQDGLVNHIVKEFIVNMIQIIMPAGASVSVQDTQVYTG